MRSFLLFLLLLTIFSLSIHSAPIQTAIRRSPTTYYNCTSNYTPSPNNSYRSNIKTLLDWLSSNSTSKDRFYNTTVSSKNTAGTVYGLFFCQRYTKINLCQECVIEAAKLMSTLCNVAKEAIVWHKICFLRYSNRYFFSTVETSPKISFMNDKDYEGQVGHFNNILWDMMNNLRTEAASASEKFAVQSINITVNQTLYGSAWCMPYLSTENCSWCLSDAIAEIPTSCCRGKTGGRVIYPSCSVRYELFPFFNTSTWEPLLLSPPPPHSPPSTTTAGKRKQQTLTIFEVVVPIVISLVLLSLGCYCFLRKKGRKNQEDILKQSCNEGVVGHDTTTLESLRYDLAKIEAATNKFSKENMIGKGGFGEVFKGVLPDGNEVAVKRLSRKSWQGIEEFKNEVSLIAKLQHKNLVKLLGYGLEGEEKFLIYEFMANKSLDKFIFDSEKRSQLDWKTCYGIIIGIARGLLYLHEESRLRIIHRDLKPNNVLLDRDMVAKISDFGMARIFCENQNAANTKRVVGT
ncbi:putative receptor-like protein kinase [Senna tora]|uniref:Putative receptor-like protein kinase n=1 Tax=Senna tora TaxID=362788 RepID=A0A834T757_9FABA|nr:putative receptor-like protein kinase [Senna tora]